MKNLNQKLLEVQKEIEAIPKDANNPFFHSKYFTIDTVLGVIKPILNKHNVRLSQPLKGTGIVTKFVDGDSGEVEEEYTDCPQNPDPQKQGAIYTYWRRYCLVSYLGLEGEQDTDANDTAPKVDPVAYATRNVPKVTSDTPFPPEMQSQQLCIECGQVLKLIPAGVSKSTGRAYKAFYACPDKHKQF